MLWTENDEPEEEEKKEEEKKEEEKKEEEKKDEPPPEIVLKVFMHCEACARKVERSLRRFEGVEEVKADYMNHTVVVKGKEADPMKICERVQKKTGRKIELISPLPKPPEEEEKPPEEPPKEEKPPEPTPITVILKVRMHCEACAHVLEKRIKKMAGVESVATDFLNSQVIVKGFIDPVKLVENIYRKTRKQASIVEEEKKEEEKKPEEEEKKEGGEEEKKEEEKKEEESNDDVKKLEFWPSKAYVEYVNVPQAQIFSDENPNACSIM
ncbi:heavy-metal-associated domain-containing protein [Escherichia coli]|uniref:heavy-metal-associated domain-containing protein n=1 Tax=Escherichia coli TaxID=562 RepID=UPI003B9A286E